MRTYGVLSLLSVAVFFLNTASQTAAQDPMPTPPPMMCHFLSGIFSRRRCIEAPDLLCRAINLVLARSMCSEVPCYGYNQETAASCVPIGTCQGLKLSNGICSQGRDCCL